MDSSKQLYAIVERLKSLESKLALYEKQTKQKSKAQPATKQKTLGSIIKEVTSEIGMLGVYRR